MQIEVPDTAVKADGGTPAHCPKCGSEDLKVIRVKDPFRKRINVKVHCYSCFHTLK